MSPLGGVSSFTQRLTVGFHVNGEPLMIRLLPSSGLGFFHLAHQFSPVPRPRPPLVSQESCPLCSRYRARFLAIVA